MGCYLGSSSCQIYFFTKYVFISYHLNLVERIQILYSLIVILMIASQHLFDPLFQIKEKFVFADQEYLLKNRFMMLSWRNLLKKLEN